MAETGQPSMTEVKIRSTEIISEEGKRSLQELQNALLNAEYSIMENGDRKYNNKDLDGYVLPLLQSLELQVSSTATITYSSAERMTAPWIYSVANLGSYEYQK